MDRSRALSRVCSPRHRLVPYLLAATLLCGVPCGSASAARPRQGPGFIAEPETLECAMEAKAKWNKSRDIQEEEEDLLAVCKSWVKEERDAEDNLQGSIAVGFDGNETGNDPEDESLYKLDLQVELSKGEYPTSLRAEAGARLQIKNDDLEEDVTNLLFNYDHYFRPWLESWTFLKRISDSYLGIEERYEVGAGVDFEWDVGRHNKDVTVYCDERDEERHGRRLPWLTGRGEEHLEAFHALLLKSTEGQQRDKAMSDYCARREGILKRNGRFRLSLAVEVLSEFEQAENFELFLDTIDADSQVVEKAEMPQTIVLPAEQRFRWALRPSILVRPSRSLTLVGRVYYKLPLDTPHRVDGVRDVRIDSEVLAEFKLGAPQNASLVASFERRHDRLPPRVPEARLDELREPHVQIRGRTVAEDTHRIYKLTVKIGLK